MIRLPEPLNIGAKAGSITLGESLTIIDRVIYHARVSPERIAFAECDRRLELVREISFGELLAKVLSGAAKLRKLAAPGERVLIFFEPGLDPLVGFLAALAARLIAVPAALPAGFAAGRESAGPRAARRLSAAANIVRDCTPRAALCSPAARGAVAALLHGSGIETPVLDWPGNSHVSQAEEDTFIAGLPCPEDVAFLQYTSGSTAQPKGVVVTHANIAHNQAGITDFVGSHSESKVISWLPMFHDMGLIGDGLNPLWVGYTAVKLNPSDFLRRPSLWLEAVAKFRGTITGGPNFAFHLAATRGFPEGETLDLSSLSTCYCGSEPIRPETLEVFTSAFQPHGLRPEALCPCYGLAEGTLIVTGLKSPNARYRTARPPAPSPAEFFTANPRMEFVSCGTVACRDARLHIRDAATRALVQDGQVGEICAVSRSVSPGYWADLPRDKRGPFPDAERILSTGDLGFLHEGELYVCGRLKNTIIVRGRKFIAEDLEALVEDAFSAENPAHASIFSVPENDREAVVVLLESRLSAEAAAAMQVRVSELISSHCGFLPDHVVVVRPSALPRTTSGKLQRQTCAALWRQNFLGYAPAEK